MSDSIKETLKEAGRLALFAAVSAVVSFGLERLGVMDQSEVSVMVGTMVLRSLDKWLHEAGKNMGKKGKGLVGGLSRF